MRFGAGSGRKHRPEHTKSNSYSMTPHRFGSGRVLSWHGVVALRFMARCTIQFNMATRFIFSKKEMKFTDCNELKRLAVEFYRGRNDEKSASDSIDRRWYDALRCGAVSRLDLLEKPLIKHGIGWRGWKVMEVRWRPGV